MTGIPAFVLLTSFPRKRESILTLLEKEQMDSCLRGNDEAKSGKR
jgi:hypothetical protein